MQCMKKLLSVFLLSLTASAQGTKTPIQLDCSVQSGDTVGAQFCTAVRDVVATSPRYREVDRNRKGYKLSLATVAIEANIETAVSIALTWDGVLLTNTVKICGTNIVQKCALESVSGFDDDVRNFEKQ